MGPIYTDEQAEDLIVRFLSGNVSQEEQKELEQWIAADAANRVRFLQLRDTWMATAPSAGYHTDNAWQTLSCRITAEPQIPAISWKRYMQQAAGYVLPFIIGGGLVFAWFAAGRKKQDPRLVTITSPKGATTRISLSDGTEVWLNAGSKLQYAQSYNRKDREVKLEGEAFFKVQTDAEKPFTVKASDLQILALGTSFNVKAYPEDKTVVTTLVEGEVKIDGSNTARPFGVMMKPHQHVVYKKPISGIHSEQMKSTAVAADSADKTQVESSEVNNTEIYTAWKDGNWIVAAQTMEELAVTMERRFNVTVKFNEEELKTYQFSGTFRQETLEQVLGILQLTAPLKYRIDNGVVTLGIDKVLREKYAKALKTGK
ncbi:FecR domain-containing protein [Chitinophaga nivalis]|uniref:FecR domain-containing protein n=1 Tax=Chitinophaga nivalis TaxID=2991709 RepID=A0ABT3IVU3_9BACT|nr:FecR domain-containing protein [Chitinophaga nivalis]MCW3462293.1 FecR domain-containing protein [Chitinophaga nivalis]MCW3488016.1 FecR domain-containing protein [Chitinophaga nivalis]